MEYWIEYMDPVESMMSQDLSDLVEDEISYSAPWYQDTGYRKVRQERLKSTLLHRYKKGHVFYTGLTRRIIEVANKHKIVVDFRADTDKMILPQYQKPSLPDGVVPRKFQEEMIPIAVELGRGVLVAPTGTGKTVLGLILISSIKGLKKVLWLCHTKDLLRQTAKEAEVFFPGRVGMIGDSIHQTDKFFTVATRQSFKDYVDDIGHIYDLVLVDEVHHIKKFFKTTKNKQGKYDQAEYAYILSKIYAEFRYGLTATTETDQQAILAMESFVGPVIGQYSVEKGIEDGVMAKPVIKISKIPHSYDIAELKTYAEVYDKGVVRRLVRNRIIVDLIKEYTSRDLRVLIFIHTIAHGQLLEGMARNAGLDTRLVNGSSDSETRLLVKEMLTSGKIGSVICSEIWSEGVNIPPLNVIINGGGGKSEIRTLQNIGRGLRTHEGKSEIILHDFFDPSHRYLISHFGERISLYCDQGWL